MKAIRLKNFRSIVDSEEININHINILLGKNSSGKSSFLRLFPMFKQSVRNELRGPVMWFDESYDFGNFTNALSRYSSEDKLIMFGFVLSLPHNKCKSEKCSDCFIYQYPKNTFLLNATECRFDMYLAGDDYGTFLKRIEINIGAYHIILKAENRTDNIIIIVNDEIIDISNIKWKYKTTGILPNMETDRESPSAYIYKLIKKIAPDEAKSIDLSDEYIYDLFNTKSFSTSYIYKKLKSKKENNSIAKFIVDNIDINSLVFKDICNNIILVNLIELLLYIDKSVSTTFNKSYYITPIRYNFSRYIRNKELAIDYIDSSGKNVMEYILSLSNDSKKLYTKFLKESLGIEVLIDEKGENKSIFIVKDGEKDNIIDVGYGYSQILPIATMLWDVASKQHKCEFSETIVIEQPEVHLHPSMQAELAKLFINAYHISAKRGNPIKLIIETHSPVIINRIGRYIRDKIIDATDVSVYLFEKKQTTQIISTQYDENGRIERWPIGFLD